MSVKDQSSRQTLAWSLAIVVGGAGFYLAQIQEGYGMFGALVSALAAFFVFGYILSRILRRAPKEITTGEGTAARSQESLANAEIATLKKVAHGEKNHAGDDLKQIKGIGPGIERQLNELDIFRFAQIADWSHAKTGLGGTSLSGGLDAKLAARAARENWVAQAQELLATDNKAA